MDFPFSSFSISLIGGLLEEEIHAELDYFHGLPIGHVGPKSEVSAAEAMTRVNTYFGWYGMRVVTLRLGPHERHNIVHQIEIPKDHTSVVGDCVICPIPDFDLALCTMVADCPTAMVVGTDRYALLHMGSSEMFDDIVGNFREAWGQEEVMKLVIGPGIRGHNYEYPLNNVPENLREFTSQTYKGGDSMGFDCTLAAQAAFKPMGIPGNRVVVSEIDPYAELKDHDGNTPWASYRWYTEKGLLCPRDLAVVAARKLKD